MTRIITLTTDFGYRDEYVGVMKGVILCHCPSVQIVDITHAIAPQNILEAARIAAVYPPFFPAETIHLVIVDPGVGTDRSILLVQAADSFYIGPDNGVLTVVLQSPSLQRCRRVAAQTGSSTTFHGRDIMAPLAGRLASGVDMAMAGSEVQAEDCVQLDLPKAKTTGAAILGEVVAIDHFGNLATSISAEDLLPYDADIIVRIMGRTIDGISTTYASSSGKTLLCLIDSRGYLEIAVNRGSAARLLGCTIGEGVEAAGRVSSPHATKGRSSH